MPHWLKKQLKKAYLEKNRYEIRLLNQCWYFYRNKYSP
ncbi:cortex morphogenetic protein CmpA [Aureibacillus halotolerans]|nr:cortex morphogenetic protein CmpA [Aureibacillus halotolerans]